MLNAMVHRARAHRRAVGRSIIVALVVVFVMIAGALAEVISPSQQLKVGGGFAEGAASVAIDSKRGGRQRRDGRHGCGGQHTRGSS